MFCRILVSQMIVGLSGCEMEIALRQTIASGYETASLAASGVWCCRLPASGYFNGLTVICTCTANIAAHQRSGIQQQPTLTDRPCVAWHEPCLLIIA
jgi:hypothetical protein